jgi:hypothetical protein
MAWFALAALDDFPLSQSQRHGIIALLSLRNSGNHRSFLTLRDYD